MENKRWHIKQIRERGKRQITLRNLIWISFTIASVSAVLLMGATFFSMFSTRSLQENAHTRELMLKQVNSNIVSYLQNMMHISDTLYYSIIKDQDVKNKDFTEQFRLLYEANRDNIKNIALFAEDGTVLSAAPEVIFKEKAKPREQKWFSEILKKSENMHFYPPHVQNLFEANDDRYEWVISLSRAVQITQEGKTKQGVLLIDLKYSGFAGLIKDVSLGENAHIFITDADGNLIYHPIRQQMQNKEREGIGQIPLEKKVGTYIEEGRDSTSETTIKMIGYTGWYLVGQTLIEGFSLSGQKGNLLILAIFLLFSTILVILNSFVSRTVARPFTKLETAVGEIENGNLQKEIRISGVYEVSHLGKAIQKMAWQLRKLMEDMVKEQEDKRKSELNSLQAQINPHFLYNTLDIIVWMISNERRQEASKAVMALSRFFRISLSKGKSIIAVKDEMEHVKNYLIIQNMRYKNKFEYTLEMEPEAAELATIKLVLQPLVENAIYHGMEFMDGDGEIDIHAWIEKESGELCLSVTDNGLGMTEEKVQELLRGSVKPAARGSGIGVTNVNQRIQLYFGEAYGLSIRSEPDEGTQMLLRMPAVKYCDMEDA